MASGRSVLVILDGTELVRQHHADSSQFFIDRLLSTELQQHGLTVRIALDGDVGHELAGVSTTEYAAIVFTSNALIRPDGPIARALVERSEDLRRFVDAGGGLIFFHQSFADDTQVFEPVGETSRVLCEARIGYADSRRAVLSAGSAEDPILHFPHAISVDRYSESEDRLWRGQFPLYYRSISIDANSSFRPVLESDSGQALLAVSGRPEGGKIVLCMIPADWAREVELVENIISYVLVGLPRIVLLDLPEKADNTDLLFSTSRLGAETGLATLQWVNDEPHLSASNQFLLSRAALAVVNGSHRSEVATSVLLDTFLRRGGTVAFIDSSTKEGVQALNVKIGSQLASRLRFGIESELALLDLSDWIPHALVFDIRDMLVAALLVRGGAIEVNYVDVVAPQLVERCTSWLAVGQGSVDAGTCVIVLWLISQVKQASLNAPIDEILAQLPPDLPTEVELVRQSLRNVTTRALVAWLSVRVEDDPDLTVSAVVRILDALVMVAPLETAAGDFSRLSTSAKARLVAVLRDAPFNEFSGWISIDATATLVSGLTLLIGEDESESNLVPMVTQGATCLARHQRSERDSLDSGSVSRIRVQAALLRLELRFPLGLHEALARLAEVGGPADYQVGTSDRVHRHLTDTREKLSAVEENYAKTRAEMLQLRRRIVQDLQVAATIGRLVWAAVLGAVMVAILYGIYSIYDAFARNLDSVTRMTYIGAVATAIPVLGAIWVAGEKFNLVPFKKVNVEDSE